MLASQYLQKHAMELGRGILAGSGIGYDRQLVVRLVLRVILQLNAPFLRSESFYAKARRSAHSPDF